jgi:hypothetical protein
MKNADQFKKTMVVAIDKAIATFGPLEEFKIEKLEKLKTEVLKVFEYCGTPASFKPYGARRLLVRLFQCG